jgi:hypothetical protein
MIAGTTSENLDYYMGKLEPTYESAGQREIARMLDEYRIPSLYKQPMLIHYHGRRTIWRPDFTLPTFDNMVIEYGADRTQPSGRATRSDVYSQNGIAALFLDDSDLAKPHWRQQLYDRLQELYSQPLAHRCNRRR